MTSFLLEPSTVFKRKKKLKKERMIEVKCKSKKIDKNRID